MKLEIISRRPAGVPHPLPLVFVHGANAGAWIWDVHLLPYLAERGFEAHAVSLRGHGQSDGREALMTFGLDDYVKDVATTVRSIGRLPVLIGHSMGGMVIQKYLQSHVAAGAVLMASVPPMGLFHTSFDMALRAPLMLQQISLVQMIGPTFPGGRETVRRMLFSKNVPDDEIDSYMPLWQPESARVVWDMMGWRLPWMPRTDVPVMVMGAEEDVFTPPNLVRATARRYEAPARVFPDMGHAMMLERDWSDVADALVEWVTDELGAGEEEAEDLRIAAE